MPAISKPMSGRQGDLSHDLKRELGAYIKGLREAAQMTQADLAQAVGIKYYTAISAIEVGRNVVPPERYYEFAVALNVKPKEFMKNVLWFTNPWAYLLLFSTDPEKAVGELNAGTISRVSLR
jgi:transcriptional regulator with XRE-family HTH domain